MRMLVLTALVAGISCRPSGSGKDDPRPLVARVSGLSGAVEVLRSGHVDWANVAKEGHLYDDDRVRTFKGAWAQLSFLGGSQLKVEEESLIAIGPVSAGGGITVERGTVEGELQAGLRVTTPALQAEPVAPRPRDIVVQ